MFTQLAVLSTNGVTLHKEGGPDVAVSLAPEIEN